MRYIKLGGGIAGGLAYLAWVFTGPIPDLEMKYRESGLMWGILVFLVLIPYIVYFIFGLINSRNRRRPQ